MQRYTKNALIPKVIWKFGIVIPKIIYKFGIRPNLRQKKAGLRNRSPAHFHIYKSKRAD